MIIKLRTKDNYTYWAESQSQSDLYLRHLIGGRWVYGDQNLSDVKKLATAHGWAVNVEVVEK